MKRSSWVSTGLLLLGILAFAILFGLTKSRAPSPVDRDGGWCCQVVKEGDFRNLTPGDTKEFIDLYNELKRLSWKAPDKKELTTKTGADYWVLFSRPTGNGALEATSRFHLFVYRPQMVDVGEGLFEVKVETIKKIMDAIKVKLSDGGARQDSDLPDNPGPRLP